MEPALYLILPRLELYQTIIPSGVCLLRSNTIYSWSSSSSYPFIFPHFSMCPIICSVCLVLNAIRLPRSLSNPTMTEPTTSSPIRVKVSSFQHCPTACLPSTSVSTYARSRAILLQNLDVMMPTLWWKDPAWEECNALSRSTWIPESLYSMTGQTVKRLKSLVTMPHLSSMDDFVELSCRTSSIL